MRGFPLISLLIVALFLGAAAVPLAVLSREKTHAAPQQVADSKADLRETTVRIKAAHPVAKASLWKEGKAIHEWQPEPGQRTLEARLTLPYVDQVMEFELHLA